MNFSAKERLGTATALAVIGVVMSAILWTGAEVEKAERQRDEVTAIAQSLTELRLATTEYALHRDERARVQWHVISDRIDRLIAEARLPGPAAWEILAGLRARRMVSLRTFGELTETAVGERTDAAYGEVSRRFDPQMFNRLLLLQQQGIADTFRLTDLANERHTTAERRLLILTFAGLAVIAMIMVVASWLLGHLVLGPIAKLQDATQQVAAGNLSHQFEGRGDNEIGQLGRSLNSMTRSLQQSFVELECRNRELDGLNEELKAFSYSVSHDLRAPLRSMDGFSLALLQDHGDRLDAEGKDFLLRIRAGSQRMGQLIDGLLGLSHVTRTELKVQPVDLAAMAREIAESLQREEPGREVTWLIEDNLPIHADQSLMRQAMQNLLENAWKFTRTTALATIRVGARMQEGMTAHYVADNGVGFDMVHADRLFSPFQRLHRTFEFPGTGIGLAIVKRIVRRHNGRIWANAKGGEGATFLFTLGDLRND